MASSVEEYPLVLTSIKEACYAITSKHVRSMTEIPEVVPVPHSPPIVRGLINLRGETIPLIDLRSRLGLASIITELGEFTSMLGQREQDHRNWIQELENSVHQRREFTLTTDPHRCAFGKWYDQFHTDDLTAQYILKQFDSPHQRIHAVAQKVEACIAEDDYAGAQELIDHTRAGDLSAMIRLFENTVNHYSEMHQEIAVVIETPEFDYAIAVDAVEAVEFLVPESIQDLPVNAGEKSDRLPSTKLGRRVKDGSVVQILDVDRICTREQIEALTATVS